MWTSKLSLKCPATGQALSLQTLGDAEKLTGRLEARTGTPFGRTELVLVRDDAKAAYPVDGDIPILLTPEALTVEMPRPDLHDRRWAEAYAEMDFYNGQKTAVIPQALLAQLRGYAEVAPFPSAGWVDAPYDAAAQLDAFNHLGPVHGQRVAQLGGSGVHAVKSLLAGAEEAFLITPMRNEAYFGSELARLVGVESRFNVVVGIAEQIPFEDEVFDAIYSGGCLHHMSTDYAGPEIMRVLVPGGRFAAVEPWQTVLHRVGTRLIGKREANSYCRPLNKDRLTPMQDVFGRLQLLHHGPLLRYLALALDKGLNRPLSPRAGLRMTRVDDALPLPSRLGGSVAVLATRP